MSKKEGSMSEDEKRITYIEVILTYIISQPESSEPYSLHRDIQFPVLVRLNGSN